jgi:hypothetical protein
MGKVAYRFLPCDDQGRAREQSQLTAIHDAAEPVAVGLVVVLMSATDADGERIPLGGTLVCRGVREHS